LVADLSCLFYAAEFADSFYLSKILVVGRFEIVRPIKATVYFQTSLLLKFYPLGFKAVCNSRQMRTTFYDGLYLAAEEQLKKVDGRRIIILLTDGLDTALKHRASFPDALNAVKRAEASVYVVSLTADVRNQIEEKTGRTRLSKIFNGYDRREVSGYLALLENSERLLSGLAAQTGGRIFLPLKDEDLTTAYQAIAEELRTQYIITYKPKPRVTAGEYRHVRVLVTDGNYEVAAREGYTGRG